ncbi:MAG: hypothetical protein HY886_01795 [Deltaproteobacteria bacterium]|nr:hypothetical protein [Deltaproteobacteria bacterium]
MSLTAVIAAIRDYLGARRFAYLKALVLPLAAIVLVLLTGLFTGAASERFTRKKAAFVRFNSTMEGYLQDRSSMSFVEKKLLMPLQKEAGAVMEEIGASIGIGKKITSYKPFDEEKQKGYEQKGVEIKADGITVNELANLLYRIENYRNLLLVREFSMKTRFDNQTLYDVTIRVTLVSKKNA